MFWDIEKVLNKNRLINMCLGGRGIGKTYGCKKYVLENFIERGEEFIYLRRNSTELVDVKAKFFKDMNEVFNDLKIESYRIDGDTILINDKVAGYFKSLSKQQNQKSSPLPDVTTIIFDEVLICENGFKRYLKNELMHFYEFLSTVIRWRDNCKVFLLSNALTSYNPYFDAFKIPLPDLENGQSIVCKGDILLQIFTDTEFSEMANNTRIGKFFNTVGYGDYAINSSFYGDNYQNIEKRTGVGWQPFINLEVCGEIFTVWCKDGQPIFIDKQSKNDCLILSYNKINMVDGAISVDAANASKIIYGLILARQNNNLRYTSLKIKSIFSKLI